MKGRSVGMSTLVYDSLLSSEPEEREPKVVCLSTPSGEAEFFRRMLEVGEKGEQFFYRYYGSLDQVEIIPVDEVFTCTKIEEREWPEELGTLIKGEMTFNIGSSRYHILEETPRIEKPKKPYWQRGRW
jgi:hypothetical protein